jgi:hypothetical protein
LPAAPAMLALAGLGGHNVAAATMMQAQDGT